MDPMLMMLLMGGVSALPALFGGGTSPPNQPSPQYPDANLLNEFGATNDWTNMLRSKWMADFYGGTASNAPINSNVAPPAGIEQDFLEMLYNGESGAGNIPEDYLMEPLTPAEQANIAGSNVPMPTRRWETTFTGTKPAAKYAASQGKVYGDSAANFGSQTSDYLKSRGIDTGGIVSGAQSELKQDYDQRAREIASKSNDIYMQTLGGLFGEVSDAGQQAAQLSGMTAQASQQWGADMDQRYRQQLAMWQNAQNQPPNPWAQAAGTMLPYLAMGAMGSGGSGGGVPQTYPAGYGVDPSVSGMAYPMKLW